MKTLIYFVLSSAIAVTGLVVSRTPTPTSVYPPIVSQTDPIVPSAPTATRSMVTGEDVVGEDANGKPALNHASGW
ncbi:MAG: hypothetical protein QM811_16755 [Pirellulales bacterium]